MPGARRAPVLLVAAAARCLRETGREEADHRARTCHEPRPAAGDALDIPKHSIAVRLGQVAAETLCPLGDLLEHLGLRLALLGPEPLCRLTQRRRCARHLLAGLVRTRVDLCSQSLTRSDLRF